MTQEALQAKYDQLRIDHEHLKKRVTDMLNAQQAYFKSHKDFQLLKVSKGIESEVKELVNPTKVKQAQLDWLGQ